MSTEAIARRIANLQALAANTPERGEAQAAAEKARQIMAKYGLNDQDANVSEPQAVAVDPRGWSIRRADVWINALAVTCAKHCGASVIILQNGSWLTLHFVGRARNVDAAAELFEYIKVQIQGLVRAGGERLNSQIGRDVGYGILLRVKQKIGKIQSAENPQNLPVIAAEREAEDFIGANFDFVSHKKPAPLIDTAAAMAGFALGDSVKIRPECGEA